MIAVALNGRLGNQLFQYAFAVALSKNLRTFYVINDNNVNDSVKKYFKQISLTDNRYARRILKKIYNKNRLKVIEQTGFEDTAILEERFQDNVYYEGFFQSVSFFCNVYSDIKRQFCVKDEYKRLFDQKYTNLFHDKKIVAIHYRIGDYIGWGGDILGGANLVLPEVYYQNALKLIPDLEKYTVVVVTDDVEGVQNRLSYLDNKVIVSDQEILDFQLLMNADKLIISNSTFAWWAAMLNKKNPQVFAPEFWIGFKVKKEYPVGILPSNFTKVSF